MAYDLDALIRRQLYLQRYANRYTADILDLYKSGDKKVVSLIRDFFDDASEKDITALLKNNMSNVFVKSFFDSITEIISAQQVAVAALVEPELFSLAESEAAYTFKALDSISKAYPSAREILKQPILGVSDITESWKRINEDNLNRIVTSVKNAAQDNLDPVQTVRGTKTQQYKDGVIWTRNRHAAATANTQVNGVASNARTASYEKFQFKKLVVSATLDFRTTPICRARDGKVYDKDEAPRPPYHFRCRTQLLPWLGEQTERNFIDSALPSKKLTPDVRKDINFGQTTDTYAEFFERQSAKDKVEILGKKRYELYKTGKYPLDKFVDERTGHYYTLAELDRL